MVTELTKDCNEAYLFMRSAWLHLLCCSTVVGMLAIGFVAKVYLVDGASLVIMKQSESEYSDYQATGKKR